MYSDWDETLHFTYITSLQVEGKPETLLTQELGHQATKYCHWEMFIVWTVYASLPATPLIPLPFIPNIHATQFRPDHCTNALNKEPFFENQLTFYLSLM
jgi:hypothetical protein